MRFNTVARVSLCGNLFADIDGSFKRRAEFQIRVMSRGKNGKAKALTKTDVSRNSIFRACW